MLKMVSLKIEKSDLYVKKNLYYFFNTNLEDFIFHNYK